jgi:hypothetical protein
MECEARLRGLYRIIFSKSISPQLGKAKPACASSTGLFLQKPSGCSGSWGRGMSCDDHSKRRQYFREVSET